MSDSHHWSVAEARQRFSEVVKAAARAPQIIVRRGRPVAAIVDLAMLRAVQRQRARTVGEVFEELRRLCDEESYRLELPERRDRANAFLGVADGPAGRYERSE